MLRVGQVVEEREDEHDVRPPERPRRRVCAARAAHAANQPATTDETGALALASTPTRDHVEAVEEEVRDHQAGDRAEDDAGVERHRDEARLDHQAAEEAEADRDEHEQVEDVDRAT